MSIVNLAAMTKTALFGVALLLTAEPSAGQTVLSAMRTSPTDWRRITARAVYAAVVDSDGTTYFADGRWPRVGALSAKGELLWERSTRGIGPGEVMFPYRVVLDEKGRVVVLDLGAKNLLWFRKDGEFLKRANLGMSFSMVSDFTVLSAGTVIVAGVSDEPRAVGRALPVLENGETWIRSFRTLPVGVSRDVQRLWGAGSVERASWRSVYFAPRGAGSIEEFDAHGTRLRLIEFEGHNMSDPSRSFVVESTLSGGRQVRMNDSVVAHGRVIALGRGGVLTSTIVRSRILLVEHDRTGRVLDSTWVGSNGDLPLSVDSTRCVLFVRSRREGELAIGQLPTRSADRQQVNTPTGEVSREKTDSDTGCGAHRRSRPR